MSDSRILSTIEITINEVLKRLSKLNGRDKLSLRKEFKEWIDAIESNEKNYDVLFINKIEVEQT